MKIEERRIHSILIACMLAFVFTPTVFAQTGGEMPVLLSLSKGIRSLTGSNSILLLNTGVEGGLVNPANLGLLDRRGVSFSHNILFLGTRYSVFGIGLPMKRFGAFNLGVSQLTTGEADRRNEFGDKLGTFRSEESIYTAGYGYTLIRFVPGLSLGTNVALYNRNMDGFKNGFYTMDLGARYSLGRNLDLGMVVNNIVSASYGGTPDQLTCTKRMVASYSLWEGVFGMFATMDMNPTRYSFGLKYSPLQKFSLQVAMDQAIYGGGINLYFEDYQFHYNMGNHSLGMNHELGLSLYFGKKSEWMAAYINRLQDDADKFINKGEYRKAFKALERARRIEKLPAEYASPHERLQKLMGQRVFKVSESGKIAEMLRRGIGHYIDKKDEVAVEVFRMALRKDRRNKMAKRLLTLARGIEDAPKRVRAVSIPKFTEVDPVKLKLVKAEQHFQDELWDMALQELKQVIEINPKEVTAYVRMGSIYWVLGMKKEAKKAWQYAWRLNHRHPEVKRAVAFMKKEGLTK